MLNTISQYRKTITALVTGIILWGYMVVASDQASISAEEWLGLAVVVAQALGVYKVANEPDPANAEAGESLIAIIVICFFLLVVLLVLLNRI